MLSARDIEYLLIVRNQFVNDERTSGVISLFCFTLLREPIVDWCELLLAVKVSLSRGIFPLYTL